MPIDKSKIVWNESQNPSRLESVPASVGSTQPATNIGIGAGQSNPPIDATKIKWEEPAAPKSGVGMMEGLGMGALRGVKDVIDTGAHALASGFDKLAGTHESDRIKAADASGTQQFEQQYGDSTAAKIGRVGGQVAATWPIGGAAGSLIKGGAAAIGAPKAVAALGDAVASGGMSAPGAGVLTRAAGGAINGALSAAAVDPASAGTGAAIGAAVPVVAGAAGRLGQAAGAMVAPFTKSGQDKIAGKVMNSMAADPAAAQAALHGAPNVIEGSAPTAAAASGDVGLAGLQRSMASRNPAFAADLAERSTQQNGARLAALEAIAGNPGKISAAEAARDEATAALRESVLERAGKLDTAGFHSRLNAMLADPSNAGILSKKAIKDFRKQLAENSVDGKVHARALYAMRKDVNDILGGKLQGESGNLKYASGQLIKIKEMIDDGLESAAARANLPGGTAVAVPGSSVGSVQAGVTAGKPIPSWRSYLETYSEMSKPIDQMHALEDVMKRIQTGSVDTNGRPILSAAKLNNVLKNDLPKIQGKLHPDQIQLLRNLQGDLNASVLANSAGRAVGSNTVQNLASDQLVSGLLGAAGNSMPAKTLLGNLARLPYARANEAVEGRLGEALLDPTLAAGLMQKAGQKTAAQRMAELPALRVGAKAVPLLATDPGRR